MTVSIQPKSPNLVGMSRQSMRDLFTEMGEKPFHADQVMKWIHQRGVTELDAMTDISKSLREKLRAQTCLEFPEVVAEYPAGDGCHKWLIRVASGSQVEMVFIPESGRGTLCVSSQAGCTLDCDFCATGKQGFNSNLSSAEIIGQLWWATCHLKGFGSKSRSVTNVVMMGMGEPLLNFDPVMEAMDIMMADQAYGLSKRRVTISTSGVVPGLRNMIGRTSVSLAISLHAPNDELRSKIMPINRRYPIAELLEAATAYMDSLTDKRVPVIEYTLIAGINDHRQHARDLAVLLKDFPCKINLIPFNPFQLSDYRRPSSTAVSNFRQILQQAGFTVTVRTTRADDIGAACGQLVGEVADQTLRSERHRNRRNQTSQGVGTDSGKPAGASAAKQKKSFTSADNLAVSADSL